jgi:hypothetical protein
MVGFGRSLLVLVLTSSFPILALLCAQTGGAQTGDGETSATTGKVRLVPRPKAPTPFSVTPLAPVPPHTIRLIPADQMNQSDQLLASNDESSIAEHALTNGFDLSDGEWNYQQIECPAFPNHLFLRYTRNKGASDLTVFSASIPRGQEGRVRIIPIMKRSYSLFAPAPINALTISAFNHIRAEEGEGNSSNWVGNGLCYAALAGATPQLPSADPPRLGVPVPGLIAVLQTEVKGGAMIRFVDAAADPKPMEWTMTFEPKGKLVKATHSPAPMITPRAVPENSAVLEERPVPPAGR